MKKIFLLVVVLVVAVSCKTYYQTYQAEIGRSTKSENVSSLIKIIPDEGRKYTPIAVGYVIEKIGDSSSARVLLLKKSEYSKNITENCYFSESVKLKKYEAQSLSKKLKDIINFNEKLDEYSIKIIEYVHYAESFDFENRGLMKSDFYLNYSIAEDGYTAKISIKTLFQSPYDMEVFPISFAQIKELDRVLDLALAAI